MTTLIPVVFSKLHHLLFRDLGIVRLGGAVDDAREGVLQEQVTMFSTVNLQ